MQIVVAEYLQIAPVWALIEACKMALARAEITQWDDLYPARGVVESDIASGALYVLEEPSACLACVTLDTIQNREYRAVPWRTEEPALIVHRLCVDPAAEGRGFAKRLMAFAETHAKERGYRSIRLDAYSGNARALGLYARRGYAEVGEVFFPRRALPFRCFEMAL